MSFAALAGGANCGPVNPLAQLSKVYATDRGVQQVRLNDGRELLVRTILTADYDGTGSLSTPIKLLSIRKLWV